MLKLTQWCQVMLLGKFRRPISFYNQSWKQSVFVLCFRLCCLADGVNMKNPGKAIHAGIKANCCFVSDFSFKCSSNFRVCE